MRHGVLILLVGCLNGETEDSAQQVVLDFDQDGYDEIVDCDDNDITIHPDAEEICDGEDNNCNGLVDEDLISFWYIDRDDDGYGSTNSEDETCDPKDGWVEYPGDCDDQNEDRNPSVPEVCDNIDNDCDDEIDEDATDALTWFADSDGDGFGDPDGSLSDCDQPSGYLESAEDCDDSDPFSFPGAEEVCGDGVANDCSKTTAADDCLPIERETAAIEFNAEDTSDSAGSSVAAGDIDGDGLVDFLIGATGVDGSRGRVYLMKGKETWDSSVDLSLAQARFTGVWAPSDVGHDIDIAGDLNGDGLTDILIGAPRHASNGSYSGSVYAMFGPLTSIVDLANSDANLVAEDNADRLGTSVAALGDVNGDGFDDFAGGAPYASNISSWHGIAYLIHGDTSLGLGNPGHKIQGDEANARIFGGSRYDRAGMSLTGPGDLNGDGLADLIVGANGYEKESGTAAIFLSPIDGDHSLSDADQLMVGELDDRAGTDLSSNDINNDGYPDLLILGADTSWLMYGNGSHEGSISLLYADAVFLQSGGTSIDATGDINADGSADIAIGNSAARDGAGVVRIFLGPPSGTLEPIDADMAIHGEPYDALGESLVGIGDIDDDGQADILVGAVGVGSEEEGDAPGGAFIFTGM